MQVNIKILIENTAPTPMVRGEYGLGVLIRVDGKGILLDAGMDDGLVKNLKALGVQASDIDVMVLSHGHFDHAGGLLNALDQIGPRDIYLHPEALWPKFVGTRERKIFTGMPGREELEKRGGRLILADAPTTVFPGVILTGTIPRTNDYEDTGGDFAREREGIWEKDPMNDDQSIIIQHPDGLIIVSGCAHAGMVNTMDYARSITGVSKMKAWIGGTHLMTANPVRLNKTIEVLKENNLEKIVVTHCTGFNAGAVMYRELGPRVVKGETGDEFAFS
jgi:7,8-dihydropterin-6-yl-methyl-4-(beta-D-ribofuranosyl)aminobenzene 5'-phosphate synthase